MQYLIFYYHNLLLIMSMPIPIKLTALGNHSLRHQLLVKYQQLKTPNQQTLTFSGYITVEIKVDRKLVKLGLWDNIGQDEYSRLTQFFYPNTDVFLIIFSVVQPHSYANAIQKWHKQIQMREVPKIFVGTGIELRETSTKESCVSKQQAKNTIQGKLHQKYFECNLNTKQVQKIIEQAARMAIKFQHKPTDSEQSSKKKCQIF